MFWQSNPPTKTPFSPLYKEKNLLQGFSLLAILGESVF
jgi:hypothetical protein